MAPSESGQTHQVDILRVLAVAQMADQSAEGGGGDLVVEIFER
jgi:hypothetical protein